MYVLIVHKRSYNNNGPDEEVGEGVPGVVCIGPFGLRKNTHLFYTYYCNVMMII